MTEPIARIEAALARLGAEHEPPAGWEARVLAATAPARRPRWLFAIPVLAAAVIAVVLWIPRDRELELAVTYTGGPTVRGESAHIGQIMHAAATGGREYRAVWVYRADALVVACPGAPPCRRLDDATIADVPLGSMGRYAIVAVTSSSPIPAPAGALDVDIAAAQSTGAIVQTQDVTVR